MRISDWSSDVCSSDLALDQRGQFLAQLVIFPFRPRGEFLAGSRQRLEPRVLQLLERLEALGYRRDFLERVGLQQLLHRRESQRIVFLVLLDAFTLLGRTDYFGTGS